MKKGNSYDLKIDNKLSTAGSSVVYQDIECVDIKPNGIYTVKFMYREWIGPLHCLITEKSSIKLSIDIKEGLVTCLHSDKKKTIYRWDTKSGSGSGGDKGSHHDVDQDNPVSYSTFSNPLFNPDKYTNELFIHKSDTQVSQYLLFLEERKSGCIDHLKKDVYKNHLIFIGASKEIANSEVDMLDFRNLITEYGNSMNSIQNLSINWDHYKQQQKKNYKIDFEPLSSTTEPIQWLTTSPNELDVTIEQREFENAVSIVEKINKIYENNPKVEIVMQTHPLKEQIQSRVKNLTDKLMTELSSPILKPNQIKETISLLVRLQQNDKAKSIFLESRSMSIQHQIKKVNISGDLIRYIGELTRIIFNGINQTCNDFTNSFPDLYMNSGLIEWVTNELEGIADIFNRQVFILDNFATISQAMRVVESHCLMMDQIGLSIGFYWNLLLQPYVEQLIVNYEIKIRDQILQHLDDENWIGTPNWDYEININNINNIKTDESSGGGGGGGGELIPTVSQSIGNIFKDYINYLLVAIQREDMVNDSHCLSIIADATFVYEDLVGRIANRFEDAMSGLRLNHLDSLYDSLLINEIKDQYSFKKAQEIVSTLVMSWDVQDYKLDEEIEPFPKKFIKLSEYLDTLADTIQSEVNSECVLPIISRIISEIVIIFSQNLQKTNYQFGYGGLQHFVLEMKYLTTFAGRYPVEDITFHLINSMIDNSVKSFAKSQNFDPETVLKPNTNSSITKLVEGPLSYLCKEHEKIKNGPTRMHIIPKSHYCIIESPVVRDSNGIVILDKHGQAKLKHGHFEIRFEQTDPFSLSPGESFKGEIKPLQVVLPNEALHIFALYDFIDDSTSIKRNSGDEYLFLGPGVYHPRIEEKVIELKKSIIIKPHQALKLRAKVDFVDRDGVKRMGGEEWLVTKTGPFINDPYEIVDKVLDPFVLDESSAIILKADRDFNDNGVERKKGDLWLLTNADTKLYIPIPEVTVEEQLQKTVLASTEFCVILDPIVTDEQGVCVNQLGKKKIIKGPAQFFRQPGETHRIENVRLLGPEDSILVSANETFEETIRNDQNTIIKTIKRKGGVRYQYFGPMELVPPPQNTTTTTKKNLNNNNTPTTTTINNVKPPFYSNLIAGGIAGIIGATTVFPMDMVKTRLQNQKVLPNGTKTYNGALDCFKKIIQTEGGVGGLYRGLSANLVGITPEKALKLAVNDLLRGVLQGDAPQITIPQEVMAGAGAGFCQVVATNPMEIVKIRMQVSGSGGNKASSLGEVVRELGIRGLYKGTAATLLRDVPFSMVYFSVYGRTKQNLTDANGNIGIDRILFSGIFAGSCAAAISTPMDVIKTRLQVKPAPGDPTYTGILDCINKTLSNEGPKAFTKGLLPRIMIISPLFGITLVCYEIQKKLFTSSSKN
eukprot:gene1991-2452_t